MENLSIGIKNLWNRLMVDRKGVSDNSFMKTEKIINCMEPNKSYKITSDNIILSDEKITILDDNIAIPKYVLVENTWNDNKTNVSTNNNILGSNGEFQVTRDLVIPIAETNVHNLAFYNCVLLKHDDVFNFESVQELPLTIMDIGDKYVDDFLLTELGGGCYLEYHNTPHIHMSLNNKSTGYLILGKFINKFLCLSAFKIPYSYAVYMKPFVVHCDGFLVGDYLVGYTVTDNFSTVLIKNNNKIAHVKIL